MRFDNVIATIFAEAERDSGARPIAWQQIVDRLAQDATAGVEAVPDLAAARLNWLKKLGEWRESIPVERRETVARSLSGRRLPADIIRFFAGDRPSVAAPLIATADPADEPWEALIPVLPGAIRALLRHREDLPVAARQALDRYRAADMVLAGPAAGIDVPAPADETRRPARISELVERIEAFRAARQHDEGRETASPTAPLDRFLFETGGDGIIAWVDSEERGALIGISLAEPAEPQGPGVDGQAAGAWRKRSAFRDARLLVAGHGPAAGEWRISAVPWFRAGDGRFAGYRGSARRARLDEQAAARPTPAPASLGLPPDALRQLVHELRTPLNAILGFSEMIEQQVIGPAAEPYRHSAGTIHREARRLMSAVDDLDAAARIEHASPPPSPSPHVPDTDVAALVRTAAGRLDLLRAEREVGMAIEFASAIAPVAVADASLDRLVGRLLSALVAVAGAGETVRIELGMAADQPSLVEIRISRPRSIAGQSEAELLDPAFGPDGDWPDAPLLGLGFSLRLARNLARAEFGDLVVGESLVVLRLPARVTADAVREGNGVHG